MPESLRALIVVVILALTVFACAHQSVCNIIEEKDFRRRRNLWLAITLTAFLSFNFWLFTLIAIPLLLYAKRKEKNLPALYFFILFALPAATNSIPGGGLIDSLFDLSYPRILELFLLLPAFLALTKQSDILPFFRTGPDKVFLAYLFLTGILYFRELTFTDSLRQCFYLFIDAFLPYFVVSRSLKNLPAFRDALLSFVVAIMLLAMIGFFEFSRSWLLYNQLISNFELKGGMGYLGRDGMLRAVATAGQAIALGYLMVVGTGFYIYQQHLIKQKLIRRLGIALLAAGLFAPLSRGPWVGLVVLFVVYFATGRNPVIRLAKFALAAILALSFIAIMPGGERIINLLPYIGSSEKENIDYRENLLTNSLIVIQRNLLFGSANYKDSPEMVTIREHQGQGILDIVNSYLRIALEGGIVGLGLFISFFALVVIGIYKAMLSLPDKYSEEYLLGRSLLATLIAILTIIFTVSSITYIPIVYWSVGGLGVAYAQMVKKNKLSK